MAIVLDVQKYEDNVSTQQTFAVGATLRVYNDYIRVMSDEWALATMATYWDDVAGKIKTAKQEGSRLKALELMGKAVGVFTPVTDTVIIAPTADQLKKELSGHLKLLKRDA